jgi:hypothetical protein
MVTCVLFKRYSLFTVSKILATGTRISSGDELYAMISGT